MKIAIALSGPGKSGKTTTVRKVYEILSSRRGVAIIEGPRGRVDIRAVLEINQKLVGIESQGDPGGRLERSLKEFKSLGCTVIVCATRSSGGTFDAVEKLAPQYEIKRVVSDAKTPRSRYEDQNRATAVKIVGLVDKRLRGA
jgi:hypothetical protein